VSPRNLPLAPEISSSSPDRRRSCPNADARREAAWLAGHHLIDEIATVIDHSIRQPCRHQKWRYSPGVAQVLAAPAAGAPAGVAAVGRPSGRKILLSLPDNAASRTACAKASPADSLGSEYYRRCDL